MKTTLLAAIIAISFFGVACNNSTNQAEGENHSEMDHDMHSDENSSMHSETESITAIDTSTLNAGDAYYQCDMHPEILSSNSGKCTKCEMPLTEKSKK